jgi:hypothetical protein
MGSAPTMARTMVRAMARAVVVVLEQESAPAFGPEAVVAVVVVLALMVPGRTPAKVRPEFLTEARRDTTKTLLFDFELPFFLYLAVPRSYRRPFRVLA